MPKRKKKRKKIGEKREKEGTYVCVCVCTCIRVHDRSLQIREGKRTYVRCRRFPEDASRFIVAKIAEGNWFLVIETRTRSNVVRAIARMRENSSSFETLRVAS